MTKTSSRLREIRERNAKRYAPTVQAAARLAQLSADLIRMEKVAAHGLGVALDGMDALAFAAYRFESILNRPGRRGTPLKNRKGM